MAMRGATPTWRRTKPGRRRWRTRTRTATASPTARSYRTQPSPGPWVRATPAIVFFVSNPSDQNTANDTPTDECNVSYRATPPAPQLLDIIGYASPASGDVSFSVVRGRSPLPIDVVRYTVNPGSNTTVYTFSSASQPFRSSVWNSKAVPDGSYTVTAQLVEKRSKAGVTPRSSSVSETIVVKNTAPVFGPVGEVVDTPAASWWHPRDAQRHRRDLRERCLGRRHALCHSHRQSDPDQALLWRELDQRDQPERNCRQLHQHPACRRGQRLQRCLGGRRVQQRQRQPNTDRAPGWHILEARPQPQQWIGKRC